MTDITTEKTSLINKMHIDFIYENRDCTIIMLDSEGSICTWNKGAEWNYYYKSNEVIGKHFSLLYNKNQIENNIPKDAIEHAIKYGNYENEIWQKRKDGTEYWCNLSIKAIFNKGQLIGFSFVSNDLTRRKRFDEQNDLNEQKFTLLVQATQDYAMLFLDPNGNITTWNIGAERMKGYKAEEIIGKNFSVFYTKEDLLRNHPTMELDYAKKNGKYEEEGIRVRKNGTKFWAHVIITALYTQNNEFIGFGKVTKDITKDKMLEELKNDFISTVSHELRTPVTSIYGSLKLLQNLDSFSFNENKKNEILEIGINNCERLIRLINNILNIKKLEADKNANTSARITLNLNELITEVVQSIEFINNKKVIFDIQFSKLVFVLGFRDKLIQVFTNIIANAIYYSPENGKISINILEESQKAKILIHDSGPGIPSKFQGQLFQKFSQADSSLTRKKTGTGLGLYIAKEILLQHNGTITFTSEEDQGTTFIVELPIKI